MLYDALRSTIAATPLPSHVNQVQYNKMLDEVLDISRTDDCHPWFSVEAHLRAVFRNYLREFIRSKNQLALRSNTPGAVIPQANYTAQQVLEQASAASVPPACCSQESTRGFHQYPAARGWQVPRKWRWQQQEAKAVREFVPA